MKFLSVASSVLMLQLMVSIGANCNDNSSPSSWLKRKEEFYKNTSFELSEANVRLLGGKFSPIHSSHLPFWFDFELYKKVFNKSYTNTDEELARHQTYIKTCVRALRDRVLYRILAGIRDTLIDERADLFYEELARGAIRSHGAAEEGGRIKFTASIELTTNENETPLQRAVRLVRKEFNLIESKNQLERYLMECDEVDGSALDGKLPY